MQSGFAALVRKSSGKIWVHQEDILTTEDRLHRWLHFSHATFEATHAILQVAQAILHTTHSILQVTHTQVYCLDLSLLFLLAR